MKPLIITIDTEGDNLWDWKYGEEIKTENVHFIERFQKLANRYGFKPTWLSNWEMLCNQEFVEIMKSYLNGCEVGVHIHAWNNPPQYNLPRFDDISKPYLTEYPLSIMEKKIQAITEKFISVFGYSPYSHRSGRWAINDEYFRLLYKYGYKYDCTITPGISWRSSKGQLPKTYGPDYRRETHKPTYREGILEIPLNTIRTHSAFMSADSCFVNSVKRIIKVIYGYPVYLRPGGYNIRILLDMIEKVHNRESESYLMFMMHSSELMPGGSPKLATVESVESLYYDIEMIFDRLQHRFEGLTLTEYGMSLTDNQLL